jgi:transketolase
MPSWDIFEHQSPEYQDSVLPPEAEARVAVEQAVNPSVGSAMWGANGPSHRHAHFRRFSAA